MHDFQGYFSRTFPDQSDFPGLSRSWNFQEKNPGLSRRRGNPVQHSNSIRLMFCASKEKVFNWFSFNSIGLRSLLFQWKFFASWPVFELPGGLGAWGFNPPVDEHHLLTGGREFWSWGSALLLQPPDQFQQDQHPYEMRVICIPVQSDLRLRPI